MAERFAIAEQRLFENVYVCRKCYARVRTQNPRATRCRKCGSYALRSKKKVLKT